MYITIEDLTEDKLNRIRWKFWLAGSSFVLDEYVEEHRESTRKRNWEVDKIYSRLVNVSRVYPQNKCLSKEDVNITKEIKLRVVEEFLRFVDFK